MAPLETAEKRQLREDVREALKELGTARRQSLAEVLGEGVLWGAGLALGVLAVGGVVRAFSEAKEAEKAEVLP